MIDPKNRIIYVDFSTLSRFNSCKEKERLGGVVGWRSNKQDPKLTFGHAFHAAVAAYYDALAGGWFDSDHYWHKFPEGPRPSATQQAQAAFLRDLKIEGNELPVTLESDERRSIERGLGLVEAYIARWHNEPYINICDVNGVPATEIGFQFHLTNFEDYSVTYVGRIDRLMLNTATQRPVIFETKTTTQALPVYIQSCKPNHQVTGYFPFARSFAGDVRECVWDCVFVSDRKANMASSERFAMYGIDLENDFKRQITTRSLTDITEWCTDCEAIALDYCRWATSTAQRWPRSAPAACHTYGGCEFRSRCSLNFDDVAAENAFMSTNFIIKPWDPTRGIVDVN